MFEGFDPCWEKKEMKGQWWFGFEKHRKFRNNLYAKRRHEPSSDLANSTFCYKPKMWGALMQWQAQAWEKTNPARLRLGFNMRNMNNPMLNLISTMPKSEWWGAEENLGGGRRSRRRPWRLTCPLPRVQSCLPQLCQLVLLHHLLGVSRSMSRSSGSSRADSSTGPSTGLSIIE